MSTIKATLTFDTETLDTLDKFCEKHDLTRSQVCRVAVRDYINAIEAKPTVQSIVAEGLSNLGLYVQGKLTKDEFDSILEGYQSVLEGVKNGDIQM